MIYDLEYFIAKFEAIPEDKWTTGRLIDEKGNMCAYGHCGVRRDEEDTDESKGLTKIIMDKGSECPTYLSDINDNNYNGYDKFGSTPRQRVVNYLKSLRK